MTKVKLDEVDSVAAYGEEHAYPLADRVLVYLLAGAMYIQADLELLNAMENHTLYGYYDRTDSDISPLRVITAVRE